MDNSTTTNFNSLSTYDLVFNLATGKYSDTDKLRVLEVIKDRETGGATATVIKMTPKPPTPPTDPKSKTFKIYNLLKDGKTPTQIAATLKKMKPSINVYPAEIYRVKNKYDL